jgi:hypothetical protein
MLRLLVISLFMHGRDRQPRPEHLSLTDFLADLGKWFRPGQCGFDSGRELD